MRASSLSYNTIAVNREIDSAYDAVLEVRDNLTNIATVAGLNIDTILADLQDAKDFTGITVVVGEVASWDPVGKVLTVPTVRGEQGIQGISGQDGESIIGPVGPRGQKGDQGIQGLKGDTGATGGPGVQGVQGPKGDKGADLTVEQIVYNGNGTFTWNFSDETVYTTPNMVGPQGLQGSKGDKGDTGISVHHTKGTSTTDSEGDFSTPGEVDTYTMYGDAAETINLGYFKVKNGDDAYTYATAGGYIGTYEEFTAMLTDFGNVKDKAQEAYTSATEAAGSAALASLAEASISPYYTQIASAVSNATNINTVAGSITNVNSVGANITNVVSVDDNETNINSVAGNSTNINTVANSIANVNNVGSNITNVVSVDGNSTNINTVAGSITNVNNLGNNITNVNNVADSLSDIETTNANLASINTIADNINDPNSEINVLGNNMGGLEYSLRSGLKYDLQQCGCSI